MEPLNWPDLGWGIECAFLTHPGILEPLVYRGDSHQATVAVKVSRAAALSIFPKHSDLAARALTKTTGCPLNVGRMELRAPGLARLSCLLGPASLLALHLVAHEMLTTLQALGSNSGDVAFISNAVQRSAARPPIKTGSC